MVPEFQAHGWLADLGALQPHRRIPAQTNSLAGWADALRARCKPQAEVLRLPLLMATEVSQRKRTGVNSHLGVLLMYSHNSNEIETVRCQAVGVGRVSVVY